MNVLAKLRDMRPRRSDQSGAMAPEYVVIIIIPAFFLVFALFGIGNSVDGTFDVLNGDSPLPPGAAPYSYPAGYVAPYTNAMGVSSGGSGTVTTPLPYSPLSPVFVPAAYPGNPGYVAPLGVTPPGGTSGGTGGTSGGTGGTTTTLPTAPALLTPMIRAMFFVNGVEMGDRAAPFLEDTNVSYQKGGNGVTVTAVAQSNPSATAGEANNLYYSSVMMNTVAAVDRSVEIRITAYNLQRTGGAALARLASTGSTLNMYAWNDQQLVNYDFYMNANNTPYGTTNHLGSMNNSSNLYMHGPSIVTPGPLAYSNYFSLTSIITMTIRAGHDIFPNIATRMTPE